VATTPTTRVTNLSRRMRLDANTVADPGTGYAQVMGVEEAKLVETRRTEDDEAYEDGGAAREAVTGYSWQIDLKLDYSTNLAGTAIDTVHAFLRTKWAATRTASAQASEFGIRWYDREGLTGDAYEGRVYIKDWKTAGGKGRETVDVVLMGQGGIAEITNPAASLTPVVSSVVPDDGDTAGSDQLVNIYGQHFTGATTVEFGAEDAVDFEVVADGHIIAIPPAQSAATVQVKVTTAAGASANTAADDYTYA
jgi:hypothetical protein